MARIDAWSLTSVQQRLVKTGGRLVKHARYYWFLLAESPNAAAVRRDAPADLGVARADRLTGGACHGVRLGEEGTQGAAGRMPTRPKVVTTARSRRQRMSTGAQARWRIMRLTNDGQIGNVG